MTRPTQVSEEKIRTSEQQYHTISEEDLFSNLSSSPDGLTAVQAEKNLAVYGLNDISHIHKRPVILQFLGHFKNLLVIILLFAAVVSVAVGEITDAAIIFIIVFASVTLDFFQEYKADNAAELLKKKIITKATVFRDGKTEELPIISLVPGDLISMTAGECTRDDVGVGARRR